MFSFPYVSKFQYMENFKLLIDKGADVTYTTSKATFSYYANEPVSEFLKC